MLLQNTIVGEIKSESCPQLFYSDLDSMVICQYELQTGWLVTVTYFREYYVTL